MKKFFLNVGIFALVFSTQVSGGDPPLDKKLWEKAQKIHHEAVVVDAHGHPFYFGAGEKEWDLGADTHASQLDLPKLKTGGVDVVFFALPIRFEKDRETKADLLRDSAAAMKRMMGKHSDRGVVVSSFDQLKKALAAGKKAGILSIEAQDIYDGNIVMLEAYRKMGYRSIVFSPSKKDSVGQSEKYDDPKNGLSDFGRKVVAEMNRLGIIVDLTHAPDQMQLDTIRTSGAPVMLSHSCTRALNDRLRNVPDHIIRELARKDGVICVTFGGGHSDPEFARKRQEAREKFKEIEKRIKKEIPDNKEKQDTALEEAWKKIFPKAPPIEKLIDHIDHIVKLVGPEHVGIGSDYGGERYYYIRDLQHAGTWPLITYHLLKRGYREADIKKILGENVLRVLEAVEKIASIK